MFAGSRVVSFVFASASAHFGAYQEPFTSKDTVHAVAQVAPAPPADDSVPLPEPATYEAGEGGDVLVKPASGDPYFLGFAAGAYRPATGERIDPELAAIVASMPVDGRPAQRTYAFVMFSKRMTADRFQVLADLGATVLDFHPHYCVKVALAPEALDAVANLDFVRWVGVPKAWQKVHPHLSGEIAKLEPGKPVPVHVNVYESDLGADSTSKPVGSVQHADPGAVVVAGDAASLPRTWMSNGWQQRRLEELGLVVRSYDDRIRAFRAELDPARLEELVELDFVQFVEAEVVNEPLHDESMAMINADRTRIAWDGGTVGGALVGVIDSGCDIQHEALDPYIVGWDFTAAGGGFFEDFDGHGSHVSGTVFGNDDVDDSYQGVAPGLGWGPSGRVYCAKIFDLVGGGNLDFATVLAAMRTPYFDGVSVTPRPHVINNSYGALPIGGIGTEAAPRQIDAEVWNEEQLYVFASGNEGPDPSTCLIQATSKNALTVGSFQDFMFNSTDPGNIWPGSSRGPCGDGRWKPNVSAPGTRINSVDAETVTGYTVKGGTSMACPHVVGVAAQLLERYSWLRYNPATLSAMLMAGTITDGDITLLSPGSNAAHLNSYGTGRIDAHKAGGGDGQQATFVWSTTLGWTDSTFVEFPVDPGATRVAVVVHYEEAAPSAGASKALRNDFDTWIDPAPFAAGNNAGDYTAQHSTVDNTEVRTINAPAVTDWRVKIAPVAAMPFETIRVGICVVVTYGDTTPLPTLDVTATDSIVRPGEDVGLSAVYGNASTIAGSVYLDSTSAGDVLTESYGTLLDGSTADWMANFTDGRDVTIGDVVHGNSRTVHWTTHWDTEGLKLFEVEARSDNAVDVTDAVGVLVDGTPPTAPTNLASATHPVGTHSCNTSVTVTWNAATDALSGLAGYSAIWNASPGTVLTMPPNLAANVTQHSENIGSSGLARYFHIAAVDQAGNVGVTAHFGPIWANASSVITYCTGKLNSLGCTPAIGSVGQPSKGAGTFTVTCSNVINNKMGLLYWGSWASNSPFQGGIKCVASPTVRTPTQVSGGSPAGNDCSGTFSFTFTNAYMTSVGIDPGETVHAQWWMRDPASASTTGLSNALRFTVCE